MNNQDNQRKKFILKYNILFFPRLIKRILSFLKNPSEIILYYKQKFTIINSGFFDREYYLENNYHLNIIYADLLRHFILEGSFYNRNPSKYFDNETYKKYYKLKDTKINPLYHYIKSLNKIKIKNSVKEVYTAILNSYIFNEEFYSTKTNLNLPKKTLVEDYHSNGWNKGISPSPFFDVNFYLNHNNDVKKSGIDPLYHYIVYGQFEGRRPFAEFDPFFYSYFYEDVKESELLPLEHFIKIGFKKNRFRNSFEVKISNNYNKYIYRCPKLTEKIKNEIKNFKIQPLISIIMPVYNVSSKYLDIAINSNKTTMVHKLGTLYNR